MSFTDVNPKGGRKRKKRKIKESSNKDSQMLKYFPVFLVVCQVLLGCVNELVLGKFWCSCCLWFCLTQVKGQAKSGLFSS